MLIRGMIVFQYFMISDPAFNNMWISTTTDNIYLINITYTTSPILFINDV